MRTKIFAVLLALAALAAPACAAEVKRSEKGMTYSVRVPAGYDVAKGAVLVVGLHGQGGNNAQFMSHIESLGLLGDALLVAPNATAGAAWEESDVDLVADLIRELRGQYRIVRAIAFGFSRGAYFSYGLGLRHPADVQAVIAHSGGLVVPVPRTPEAEAQVFYVIHGDADGTVPVEQSRDAVKRLEAAGLKHVKYEEVPHLAHTVDRAAVKRGLEWIEGVLGPAVPALTDAQAAERIAALEKALRAKDFAAAAEAFDRLEGAPRAAAPKIASLAKTHAVSPDERLAIAAVKAAGRLGEPGLPALKAGLKGKSEPAAIEAAHALGASGGDAATAILIGALPEIEAAKSKPELEKAVHAALTRITGKDFASAREWKRWAGGKS